MPFRCIFYKKIQFPIQFLKLKPVAAQRGSRKEQNRLSGFKNRINAKKADPGMIRDRPDLLFSEKA
jgi:hypothetical protein